MGQQSKLKPIGIMGGTFDPVHNGHLRVAEELGEFFGLKEIRLMPCHQPVHRDAPMVSPEHRQKMLELAIETSNMLTVDTRELEREGPSYTVDTLRELRAEVGDETPIYFAMGSDAFNAIDTWKKWKKLFELANIVVIHRPGAELAVHSDFVKEKMAWFSGKHVPAGKVYELTVSPLAISSTQIRRLLNFERSIKYLLPESVEKYINKQKLYQ